MHARTCLTAGVLGAGLAVAAGAFGAHYLKNTVQLDAAALQTFETGARYQMYHSLALLLVGVWSAQRPSRSLRCAAACFAVGIVLFSGSLYLLATTGVAAFGFSVVFGGIAFLAGWGAALTAAVRG